MGVDKYISSLYLFLTVYRLPKMWQRKEVRAAVLDASNA